MDDIFRKFKITNNRTIVVGNDGNNIVAEHNNVEIGIFDFDTNDNGFLLTNCKIEEDYQRNGIGEVMIEAAELWHYDFEIVDHLSEEGAAFINYCTENIFKLNHDLIKDDRF